MDLNEKLAKLDLNEKLTTMDLNEKLRTTVDLKQKAGQTGFKTKS